MSFGIEEGERDRRESNAEVGGGKKEGGYKVTTFGAWMYFGDAKCKLRREQVEKKRLRPFIGLDGFEQYCVW